MSNSNKSILRQIWGGCYDAVRLFDVFIGKLLLFPLALVSVFLLEHGGKALILLALCVAAKQVMGAV
jgi:hypothetical protein